MSYPLSGQVLYNFDFSLKISYFSYVFRDLKINFTPFFLNCTARQYSPCRRKCLECSINNPALSLLMKHLVIGQRQKAPNFSAFHWSPHGSPVSISQHFVITRVVHLPKTTETSLITESDQAVHSCNSWFLMFHLKIGAIS